MIFQYYLPQFAELAAYLRRNGVGCHFCAGGHYPSMRYEEVLEAVPALDCVVRGEGEETLLELMRCLAKGCDWHAVMGLAYRSRNGCVITQPRPLISDLDVLPYPERAGKTLTVLGKGVAPLLASRGCAEDCSFCSIRQFYSQSPGRKVRIRNPAKVVEEMRTLKENNGISIFLFQDDDFPIRGAFGRRWAGEFSEALEASELAGAVIWKISCRPDEVDWELFRQLRQGGLYMVYLGFESGNEEGLRALNKRLSVGDSLQAVAILRKLQIRMTYGFMMFDPSSSFESIRTNVTFLRQITEDGSVAATFCRMLPYAGTPIEESLTEAGRLRGSREDPDYEFLDPRLDAYFKRLSPLMNDWIRDTDSLASRLNWAWQEFEVMKRLFPPLTGQAAYAKALGSLTRQCNNFILDLVEGSSRAYELGEDRDALPGPADFRKTCLQFGQQLLGLRDAFVRRNETLLLESLRAKAPTARR